MPITELLDLVMKWEEKIRMILDDDGFWFVTLSPDDSGIDITAKEIGEHRVTLARKNQKSSMEKVGPK